MNRSGGRPAGLSDSDEDSDNSGLEFCGPGFSGATGSCGVIMSHRDNPTDDGAAGGIRGEGDYRNTSSNQFPYWRFVMAVGKDLGELAIEIFKQEKDLGVDTVDEKPNRPSLGWTPLLHASAAAIPSLVKFLIGEGASVDDVDREGHSCLMVFGGGRRDEERIVKTATILIRAGGDVNRRDVQGISPLMYAVINNFPALTRFLIDEGANVNLGDRIERTALMIAAEMGDGPMVALLLERGANITIISHRGLNASDYAYNAKQFQMSSLLFQMEEVKKRGEDGLDILEKIRSTAYQIPPAQPPCRGGEEYHDKEVAGFMSHIRLNGYGKILQRLTYERLLVITKEELREMGVKSLGHRMRITDAVREIHNMDWEPTSLHDLQKQRSITAPEADAVLRNIRRQLDMMRTSVEYLQVRDNRPLEEGTPQEIIQFLTRPLNNTRHILARLALLKSTLIQTEERRAELGIGDGLGSSPSVRWTRWLAAVIGIGAVVVVKRKLIFNLLRPSIQ